MESLPTYDRRTISLHDEVNIKYTEYHQHRKQNAFSLFLPSRGCGTELYLENPRQPVLLTPTNNKICLPTYRYIYR